MRTRVDPKTGFRHFVDPLTNKLIYDEECSCGHSKSDHSRRVSRNKYSIGCGSCQAGMGTKDPCTCSCQKFEMARYIFVDEIQ
jgi:hypothetical protein